MNFDTVDEEFIWRITVATAAEGFDAFPATYSCISSLSMPTGAEPRNEETFPESLNARKPVPYVELRTEAGRKANTGVEDCRGVVRCVRAGYANATPTEATTRTAITTARTFKRDLP